MYEQINGKQQKSLHKEASATNFAPYNHWSAQAAEWPTAIQRNSLLTHWPPHARCLVSCRGVRPKWSWAWFSALRFALPFQNLSLCLIGESGADTVVFQISILAIKFNAKICNPFGFLEQQEFVKNIESSKDKLKVSSLWKKSL